MALAAVCLFWGTTYLGIRIALESLSPFYLIAIRYLISGSLLCFVAVIARTPLPDRREFLLTSICGIICIGIGNGSLAVSEQWVPSGLAALFLTTLPFWMVGIDAVLPGGKRPRLATVRGLIFGLIGVAALVLPQILRNGLTGKIVTGFFVQQIGAVGWVLGSTLQKRVSGRAHPFVSGAIQQLATGIAMFMPAALFEHVPSHINARPAWAIVYLVIFGSVVGYSAFIYSMSALPIAVVSIYTYVNPIVAVTLGWIFFRENFGWRESSAMLIIFAGIAIVKSSESVKSEPAGVPVAEPES